MKIHRKSCDIILEFKTYRLDYENIICQEFTFLIIYML